MSVLRVVVVEDSLTVRRYLVAVLSADPLIEVVGEAGDGRAGVELCARLRPDVVTMDMMLPIMDGLEATRHIMSRHPIPILVVSSSTNRGELFRTYDALAAGAVDVMEKPAGTEPAGVWERQFVATVKMVARISVVTRHPRGHSFGTNGINPAATDRTRAGGGASAPASGRPEVIAIGVSTGGPSALVEVLGALHGELRIPVFFVLHIGEAFAASFAEWLEGQIKLSVVRATGGESVAGLAGTVVMAPPGRHMLVKAGRVRLLDTPERHSCRPSVDELFESVAAEYGQRACGILLTGMGRDGASGLLRMRQAGGHTIAQDEATSVVYGMPREAAVLGAAAEILPLPAIGSRLAALARVQQVGTP